MKVLIVLSAVIISCIAQRSPYAGRQPIGYPQIIESNTDAADQLANRFGDDEPTTTIRLPVETLGDAALFKRLSKLPVDQQPFWLINWRALEAQRENPQTYQQRVNSFIDSSSNVRS